MLHTELTWCIHYYYAAYRITVVYT